MASDERELVYGLHPVHRALPLVPRDDVSTYAVSTDFLDGDVTEYTLAWGMDTCAQANHGC